VEVARDRLALTINNLQFRNIVKRRLPLLVRRVEL
jgi:hypothetical protein